VREPVHPPVAQQPRRVRNARNLAVVIGLIGFAFVLRGGDSAIAVGVMSGAVVLAAVVFFAGVVRAQNRLWSAQDALLEALGLEADSKHRFSGEVDGVPVAIVLKTKTGRVQSDYRERRRAVTTVEATEVFIGRDRESPPRRLRELGVREDGGRWRWSGEKNTLDDPAMERFIRLLVGHGRSAD